MFTSLCCKHCNYCIISTIQEIMRDIVRLRIARQNRILRLSFPLFRNSASKVDRETLLYRINLHRLVYIIIALMVNIIWLHKSQSFNTQATTQKRTENKCHLGRVIYLCSLERFISKSLQDRKKLQTNYSYQYGV